MAHYPLNHHLRQTYRFLAFLAGAYLLVTGVIGLAATWGDSFFGLDGHDWSLGLRVNPAGSWLLTVLGLIVVAATLIGGNVHHQVTLVAGWAMLGIAVLILATLQTDANAVNASMINVLILLILGVVILVAGLYGKVGSRRAPLPLSPLLDLPGLYLTFRVSRLGFASRWDRPFHARLTRWAATISFFGLRTSRHHWPTSATMPTSACE
jgi:hypothetical protein